MTKLGFTKKQLGTLGSLALFLALVLGPLASALAAQEITGNISGEVKDQTGAVVPNAKVTATGAQRTVTKTTDSEGRYRFDNLQPGPDGTITIRFYSPGRVDLPGEVGRRDRPRRGRIAAVSGDEPGCHAYGPETQVSLVVVVPLSDSTVF